MMRAAGRQLLRRTLPPAATAAPALQAAADDALAAGASTTPTAAAAAGCVHLWRSFAASGNKPGASASGGGSDARGTGAGGASKLEGILQQQLEAHLAEGPEGDPSYDAKLVLLAGLVEQARAGNVDAVVQVVKDTVFPAVKARQLARQKKERKRAFIAVAAMTVAFLIANTFCPAISTTQRGWVPYHYAFVPYSQEE